MRISKLIFFIFFLLTAVSAKAQFFSFYLSGADGNTPIFDYTLDVCVPTTANVGDETTSPNGNKAKILSIDGPSQECANATPAQSIRAKKSFHFLPSEKAGLTIPDDFVKQPLNDLTKFNGSVLFAKGSNAKDSDIRRSLGVIVLNNQNAKDFIRKMESKFLNSENFQNGHLVKQEEYDFNGMKGYRSEVQTTYIDQQGALDIVILLTAYAYKDRVIYIHALAPKYQFESLRIQYTQIPLSITGLRGDGPISSPSKSSPAIDQFKQQCKDLGFKPGTEKFGNCVLELNK
jgi:hypothetical protein